MNRVYEQRIRIAASLAAFSGLEIAFHVEGGFPSYLVWYASRKRHVISSGSKRGMELMLPEVRAEFDRRVRELVAAEPVKF